MKKKETCSRKCSSKVKTNNYSNTTNDRALLLIEPNAKSLQLN